MRLMHIEKVIKLLFPNMDIKTYLYENKKLIEVEEDLTLEQEALALIYILDDMYKNRSFK